MLLAFLLPWGAAAWAAPGYLGFDRNDYPGDALLPALRQTFRYTGYWLNNPPGETHNSWTGKRAILKANGFGFLVLFTGRTDAQLKGRDAAGIDAGALGRADGRAAVTAAAREGFAPNVRIFLDQEEGGRLLPEQAAYLLAWIEAVEAAGARAGVYCSGIPVAESGGAISTAQDIVERWSSMPRRGQSRLALWIADDRCPPSPGCSMTPPAPAAAFPQSTPAWVTVWQYAQSPRRARYSAACPHNDAAGGNCYAPGLPQNANSFVDLDSASSPDPSEAP